MIHVDCTSMLVVNNLTNRMDLIKKVVEDNRLVSKSNWFI